MGVRRVGTFAAIVMACAYLGGPATPAAAVPGSGVAELAGYAVDVAGVTAATVTFTVPDVRFGCPSQDQYGIAVGLGVPRDGAVESLGSVLIRCIGSHFNPPYDYSLLAVVGDAQQSDAHAKAGDEITISYEIHDGVLTMTVRNPRHHHSAVMSGPAPTDGRLVVGSFPDVYRQPGTTLPPPEFGQVVLHDITVNELPLTEGKRIKGAHEKVSKLGSGRFTLTYKD
jgi:hypothetical protein